MKTTIEEEGQPYVDEPMYAQPKVVSMIEKSVASASGRRLASPIFIGYERVYLRWMKPDGKGGLVPK